MLEDKDKIIKAVLESRDGEWLNSLQHCRDRLRLNTQELINNKCTLKSIGKRQCELVKSNADILDWAMKTVLGKKKVSLPIIQISDYVPYTIVPKDVTNPSISFTHPKKTR